MTMTPYRLSDVAQFHNKNPNQIKVIVGMSGGVDSSVSAVLLKEAGFEMLPTWQDATDRYCKELKKIR